MRTNTYKRNHTVSAGYIGRFASNGRVTVHHATKGVFEIGPKGVGFQNDFWGSADLSREVEQAFSKCESPVLRMLRDLPQRWPLDTADRAVLAQFVAIHVVRTPAFGAFVRRIGERINEYVIREVAPRFRLTESELAAAMKLFRGQRYHIRQLLRQSNRIGSVLGSMQWSLVQFDQDRLIASDQPVVMLPLSPATLSPASSIPAYASSFSNMLEARFTLDPRHLLLMTWADTPDTADLLSGTYSQACSVNCAIRAQSLEEWVCRPQTTPPFLSPPILIPSIYPISTELLPGHSVQVVIHSRRRDAALRLVSELIEEGAPDDYMSWVSIP